MNISSNLTRHKFRMTALSLALSTTGVMAQSVSQAVEGQQSPVDVSAQAFEEIVVVGDADAEPVPWATQTDRKELGTLQIFDLNQFGARAQPGVNFNQTTNSVNIRGLEGTRVVTRIDGVRQSYLKDIRGDMGGVSGGSNAFDFGSLGAIDVIRGTDSTAVGSGALGGVLDVRTLEPDDLIDPNRGFGVIGKTGYQSVDNSWFLNSGVAAETDGGLKWLLQAGVRSGNAIENKALMGGYGATRQQRNPRSYTQQNYLIKLKQQFDGGHVLGLSAAYFDRSDDITKLDAATTIYVPGQSFQNEGTNRQSVALDYAWTSASGDALIDTFAAKAYWQKIRLESAQNAVRHRTPKGDYFRKNSIQESMYGLSMDLSKAFYGDISQLWEAGAEFYSTRVEQSLIGRDSCPAVPAPFSTCAFFHTNQSDIPDTDGKHYSFWIQNTIGFLDDTVLLAPALRYDDYEFTPDQSGDFAKNPVGILMPSNSGQAWSPKVMLTWKPVERLSLYAQYAVGFNAPTATQLYSRYGAPGSYLIEGNPGLKAEKSHGWEFGTRFGDSRLNGSIAYFDNSYSNFIDEVARPGTPQYPLAIRSFKNLQDVRIYGIEARGHWEFSKGWSVFGSLAWAVGKDRATDTYLNSVAPFRAIAGIAYDQQEWGVRGQLTAAAARTNVAYPNATPAAPNPDFQAPGYGVVDLTAYWKPSQVKGLTVQAGVFNVFDKTYWNALDVPTAGVNKIARGVDFYTQPGRNFAVSLTYQY